MNRNKNRFFIFFSPYKRRRAAGAVILPVFKFVQASARRASGRPAFSDIFAYCSMTGGN
jgi:hypothetical protein